MTEPDPELPLDPLMGTIISMTLMVVELERRAGRAVGIKSEALLMRARIARASVGRALAAVSQG